MRIFVGSSSESKRYADDVSQTLRELGAKPMDWNAEEVFIPGKTIIDTFEHIGKKCQAAILVAGEDDQTMSRTKNDWTPRDNVLWELGYFTGKFGLDRAIIVRAGKPKLPSDLGGVIYVQVPGKSRTGKHDSSAVRAILRDKLRPWLEGFPTGGNEPDGFSSLVENLGPRLSQLKNAKDWPTGQD